MFLYFEVFVFSTHTLNLLLMIIVCYFKNKKFRGQNVFRLSQNLGFLFFTVSPAKY